MYIYGRCLFFRHISPPFAQSVPIRFFFLYRKHYCDLKGTLWGPHSLTNYDKAITYFKFLVCCIQHQRRKHLPPQTLGFFCFVMEMREKKHETINSYKLNPSPQRTVYMSHAKLFQEISVDFHKEIPGSGPVDTNPHQFTLICYDFCILYIYFLVTMFSLHFY